MKILVLGIGNTLLTDEGVGIVAMRELEARFGAREDMEFIDGGTLSFTLAAPIKLWRGYISGDSDQRRRVRLDWFCAFKSKFYWWSLVNQD